MKYRTPLCWGIFVFHLLFSLALCWLIVGIGMASSDSVGAQSAARPQVLDNVDGLITLLGFPLIPIGKIVAHYAAMPEALNVIIGITLYVANGWVLAYWMSLGVIKGVKKFSSSTKT